MIANQSGQLKSTRLTFLWVACCLLGLSLSTTTFAVDEFTLGTGNGPADTTGVLVPLSAKHDQAMQGFSIALSFDALNLQMTGVSFAGTETEVVSPGGTPDYVGTEIDNNLGQATSGVIFGFSPVPPLNQLPQIPASPDEDNVLVNLVFDINEDALPGDYPVQFESALGNPSISNVYSTDGFSVAPSLVDGQVTVTNLHRFYFDPVVTVVDGEFGATLKYDHAMDTMTGFVISITYDSAKLSLTMPATNEAWWTGTDLGLALGSETIEFFDIKTIPAFPMPGTGYLALIAVFDFTGPFAGQSLGPGLAQSVVRMNFNVANNIGLAGTTTTIHFDDTVQPAPPPPTPTNPNPDIPPPTVNLVVTDSAQGISPIKDDGLVTITDEPSFVRGNANSASPVDLADVIFLLQYLFSMGTSPTCLDTGDINDDGQIDISDTITLLNYLFTDGAPPANPFPGCGLDGTPDSFADCTISIGNCP